MTMADPTRAGPIHAGEASAEDARPAARWPAAQTRPEDVFLAWLLALPENADTAAAARREIARLDRAAPLGAGPERLRTLMVELARTA